MNHAELGGLIWQLRSHENCLMMLWFGDNTIASGGCKRRLGNGGALGEAEGWGR